MAEILSPSSPEATLSGQEWCLAYHAILPQRSEYLYDVSVAQFEEHLELFSPCNTVGQPTPKLTFDDGHLSNYKNAFPVLEECGIRATFFLVAGLIGVVPSYITWQQAREMAAAGHRLQSHGWSHRLLTTCDPKQLDEELVRSKGKLEDRLGAEVDSLSMPGGRLDRRVIERSAKAGYKFIFHSNPWVNPIVIDGANICGRLMVTRRMARVSLQKLMESGPARRMYFRTKYRFKERMRLTLGDRLYFRMWCWKANGRPAFGMGASITQEDETTPTDGHCPGDTRV